jgi:ATP-dependent DNA helicase RecG
MAISSRTALNKRYAAKLAKLDIRTARDLLLHFPFRYEDFSHVKKVAELVADESATVRCAVKEVRATPRFGRHMGRTEAVVSDDTGSLRVTWFNQPWVARQIVKGDELFLSGVVQYHGHLVLMNPQHEKVTEERVHAGRIVPIYPSTAGLPQKTLRDLVHGALANLDEISENLPGDALRTLKLPLVRTAIKELHFPQNEKTLAAAQRRMAFEEILVVQLAVAQHRAQIRAQRALQVPFDQVLIKEFLATLPFTLTLGQKRALWDILKDLEKTTPMNRLLEGDVGSGKTLVAFAAALEALQQSYEVAILCPTEILAQQHYASALERFAGYVHVSCILLTGKSAKLNGAEVPKKTVLEEIAHGGPHLIIGTHATLEKNITFKNLALVVIDEQHRFGVRQRATLTSGKTHPHLLSMTATPIPRTLRLAMFGDLEVSAIREKPVGRKPVVTKLVQPEERTRAYEFIATEIAKGRQAFVVTPLIEESAESKSATTELENLKKVFPQFKIGLLHGKMAGVQKEAAMADFLANKTQVLVSTSVIEVGVDVPNASVMVVEGADRFGLAQLHQLRGRVGRADHQSYCMLFAAAASATGERLEKFVQIHDGFALAELDMQLRGSGDVFGDQQSGFYSFKFFSFADHADLNRAAKEWAIKLLSVDPKLAGYPDLKAGVKQKFVHLE